MTASACAGDSGGPLVDRKTDDILGIVSYSIKSHSDSECGDYIRTIFTSVAEHKKWLERLVWDIEMSEDCDDDDDKDDDDDDDKDDDESEDKDDDED